MAKRKFLPETHPHLLEEWDYTKNGNLRPEDLTFGSNKKTWWFCKKEGCRYEWKAFIHNRTKKIKPRGCPACAGKVVTETNNLAVLFSHLLEEWDYEKNEIGPEEVTPGLGKKVWWKCSNIKCRCEWRALVCQRTKKVNPTGCPACAGQVVTDENNLKIKHPEIAKEWDFEKNRIRPEEITPGSDKKVWWKCQKCGCGWEAQVYNRTKRVKPTGCPACVGRVVTENNNLAVRFPEMCKEWDYEKNEVRPEEITSGSGKRVWWKCSNKKCGYSWRTVVANRTGKDKSGCPVCSRRPISRISQKWLDSLNISQELREYKIKIGGSFFRVDGFNPKINTVYEFLGDYWHGNPKIYPPEKINPTNKKSYGQLYQETMERIEILKENGYKVVYVWESDFA